MIYDEIEETLKTALGTHAGMLISALNQTLGGRRVYFPKKTAPARIGTETVLQVSRRTGIARGKLYASLGVLNSTTR